MVARGCLRFEGEDVLDIMTGAPKQIKIGSEERSRTVMVGPLKLTEFGILQRWIREHGEPPLVRLEEELKVAPESEHRNLRYEAWREQRDDWPPAPYTMKGAKILFATAEGIRFFLEVFLRKHNPSVTDDEITFYMACMGMAELDTMATIALGASHGDALVEDEVDRKLASRLRATKGFGRAWGEYFYSAYIKPPHKLPHELAELTFPQIYVLSRKGILPPPPRPLSENRAVVRGGIVSR
jgi:hypothetical protein